MPKVAPIVVPIPEVLKALSDEMRWSIVAQMSEVDELACTTLEQTLPVSKPTISYHVKVLYHAGLIEIRKEGRHYYYRLRRDVLDSVLGEVAIQLGVADPGAAGRGTTARAPRSARTTTVTRGTRTMSGQARAARSA
jgi:DNA-binding transcriptional ArsR family regulator